MYQRKLTISKYIYEKLLYDEEMFSLNMSDSGFVSKIIVDTYNYIAEKECKYVNIINDSNRLIKKIIFVRETKNTLNFLKNIEYENKENVPATKIFIDLIKKYLSFPQYIREQILFSKNYNILEQEKNKKALTFELEKNTYEAIVYDILPGREEFYNYAICYGHNIIDTSDNKILSFKLSNIKNLNLVSKNEITKIDDKIKKELENKSVIPEFAGFKSIKISVIFDNEGLKLLDKLYKDRPIIISRRNNKIEFHCPESQLTNYLKQFGWHVYTNSEKINNELLKYHFKAFVLFNENKPDDFKNIVSDDLINNFNKEIEQYKTNLISNKKLFSDEN